MPTERLSMRRIRDLLRLKFENGLSSRVIAASLGISKGAVGDYLQRVQVAGLSWPLSDDMTASPEAAVVSGPAEGVGCSARSEPNWAQVDQELRRTGVTRSLLWQEYRADHPEGMVMLGSANIATPGSDGCRRLCARATSPTTPSTSSPRWPVQQSPPERLQ